MHKSSVSMLAFVMATFAATPASALFVTSGSGEITADDPIQNARIFRDAIPSTWAAPKAFPGEFAGAWSYDIVSVGFAANAGQDVYYEITVANLDDVTPHSVAYDGSFDPNNISLNYLGDSGSTPAPGETFIYQVIVAAGGSLLLNFSGVNAQFGRYEYSVAAFSDADRNEDFVTPGVPEPASWALMIAGFGLVGGAMRRRAVPLAA